jgi:glycerol kinase
MEYVLEGSVFVGGAIIRWLRDEMKLIHDSKDSEYFARKVPDSGGVYLIPAFAGLGAPYWDMHARGTVLGLTAGVGKNHLIRAALESIAYQTEDVLEAMNGDMKALNGTTVRSLKVDGGASANDLLMQMQSDFSGIEVARSSNPEATAAGAAYLAGLAVGFFKDRDELRSKTAKGKTFTPQITAEERKKRLAGWHRGIEACRVFGESEG